MLFSCSDQNDLSVAVVGDIYFNRGTFQHIDLTSTKLKGDLVIGNLEGFIDSMYQPDEIKKNILSMPVESMKILKDIGFNALCINNNHALDKGWYVYQNSLCLLQENGFYIAGMDDTGFVFTPRKGIQIRCIGFSFEGSNNVNNISQAVSLIQSCDEKIVIVEAHMGTEDETAYMIGEGTEYYMKERRGDVRKFAHACIDAGADIIIGHGPHVLREVELYKNRIIFYSLGNFIFNHPKFEKELILPSVAVHIRINENGDFIKAKVKNLILKNGIPGYDRHCLGFYMLESLSDDKDLYFNKKLFGRCFIIPN